MIHYIVIRYPFDRDHMPSAEHETFESALAEARRLAAKHTAYEFRVFKFYGKAWAKVEIKELSIVDALP